MTINRIFYLTMMFALMLFAYSCGSPEAPSEPSFLMGRYVENYDENYNPVENWWYDSTDNLEMRMTFTYDTNGLNTETLLYDAAGVQIGRFAYEYNGDGCITRGERYETGPAPVESYDALYENASYPLCNTSYIVYDETEAQVMRRITTWGPNGYMTEDFYDATDTRYETYAATYNGSGQYVQEDHTLVLASDYLPGDPEYAGTFEINSTYKYFWNDLGYEYLQEDYDADTGELCQMIIYEYDGHLKEYKRTFYKGVLQYYIHYGNYDNAMDNYASESMYIPGAQADFLQTSYERRLYSNGGKNYYEEKSFSYGQPPSGNRGTSPGAGKDGFIGAAYARFLSPAQSHYH